MSLDPLLAPALVVVDIQAGTLPNAVAVPAGGMIAATGRVIRGFRAVARPVVFVVSTGTARGLTAHGPGGRLWPDGFDELDPRLGRLDSEPLLRRVGWSAFAGTDLVDRLHDSGTREIVIVGLATTFGVESTARQAADLGFDVVVVSDAVSDPDPAGHERAVTRVFPALGRVAGAAEIVAALGIRDQGD